jgi:hypothetical protein
MVSRRRSGSNKPPWPGRTISICIPTVDVCEWREDPSRCLRTKILPKGWVRSGFHVLNPDRQDFKPYDNSEALASQVGGRPLPSPAPQKSATGVQEPTGGACESAVLAYILCSLTPENPKTIPFPQSLGMGTPAQSLLKASFQNGRRDVGAAAFPRVMACQACQACQAGR